MIVWTERSRSVVFGFGEVHRQSVVERDRSGGHLDEHRLDAADLGVGEDVVGLAEEDVDELAHADEVAPGHVAHRTRRERGTDERDPRRHRCGLGDRPVRVVLVRIGLATARLLVERLVVPEADRVDLEQLGGGLADPLVERQPRDIRRRPPTGSCTG